MASLIYKEQLIKDINELPTASTYPGEMKMAILLNIVAAPTIDAEPVRHGQWLTHEGVRGAAYCSVCCYELRTNNTNYCPHRGAKMDGDK